MYKNERAAALKSVVPVLCIFALLAAVFAGSVGRAVRAAADTAEVSGNSITIYSKVDADPVEGMAYNIYKVGERVGGSFELYGDFAEFPVSLDELFVSSAMDAANTLEVYARVNNIAPAASAVSDAEGKAFADGLADGVYLISGDGMTADHKVYSPSPALVEIAGEDVEVYAKIGVEDEPYPVQVTYKVIKLWQNETDESARPAEIEVELYKNGELYDTVTLDEGNEWEYEWEGLEDEEWTVVEKVVPENYTVIYREEGGEFAIINTREDPDDSSSSADSEGSSSSVDDSMTNDSNSSDVSSSSQSSSSNPGSSSSHPEKVPQTGQLWWPVPVLCVAGLVFVAVGIRLKKRSGK